MRKNPHILKCHLPVPVAPVLPLDLLAPEVPAALFRLPVPAALRDPEDKCYKRDLEDYNYSDAICHKNYLYYQKNFFVHNMFPF